MKNIVIFIFISLFTTLLFCTQMAYSATYKNGMLMPSSLSTQQLNKTNSNIRNDILNYNSVLSTQNEEAEQKNNYDNLKNKEQIDKYFDSNPHWWRWENTNQGYTYFY